MPTQLTIAEWRKNPDLVSRAREVLANPALQEMLAILSREPHCYHPDELIHLPAQSHSLGLGIIYGHRSAIEKLQLFAQDEATSQPIQSSYEDPFKKDKPNE